MHNSVYYFLKIQHISAGLECVRREFVVEEKNNRIPFHWEKSFIFIHIAFIVLLLQQGRHEHTLFVNILLQFETNPVETRLVFLSSCLGEIEIGLFLG